MPFRLQVQRWTSSNAPYQACSPPCTRGDKLHCEYVTDLKPGWQKNSQYIALAVVWWGLMQCRRLCFLPISMAICIGLNNTRQGDVRDLMNDTDTACSCPMWSSLLIFISHEQRLCSVARLIGLDFSSFGRCSHAHALI